ncbi:RNase P subunit p30 family protein [Salarchaeum sp. JOR-1]|uniref:RNase P subunit p30 family protein n=1 Tax=Salarchaeum sp. JOR-1 TaxID=2599399 RepID=UPI0011985B2D|nr:RNase P subunit p30 family protein [Salarchaeum sp. JOR-1]QDX41595.1 ribonuclease P [Salarchaeum sp. JOR-1]
MYEAAFAQPDGASTVARVAETLAGVGYDGVVVRSRADTRPDFDAERVREEHGIDVVEGVTVDAEDPTGASGAVANLRSEATVLCVHGGNETMNRYVAEEEKVDVLSRPGSEVNQVVVKAAKRNAVRVEFDFGPVLRESGGRRVQALRGLRKLREIVDHYDAPYVVSATPRNHLAVRAPRELVAVGEQAGFSEEWIRAGLREWGVLAARNRERMSADFIAPGVRRGRYEEDA